MLVQTKTEGNYPSDWLLFEVDEIGRFSRENLQLNTGNVIKTGCPLKWTSAGKTEVEPVTDGTAQYGFAGLAFSDADSTGGDLKIAVVVREARIVFEKLGFHVDMDNTEKAALKVLMLAQAPSIVYAVPV